MDAPLLTPIPGRIEVRIDLLGAGAPGQRLLRFTHVSEDKRHVGHVPLVVRVELDGAPHVSKGKPEGASIHGAAHAVPGTRW